MANWDELNKRFGGQTQTGSSSGGWESLNTFARNKIEQETKQKRLSTAQETAKSALAGYEESQKGVASWVNRFLGRGTPSPVLVGETPEYTTRREEETAEMSKSPIRKTVDFFTEGERNLGEGIGKILNLSDIAETRAREVQNNVNFIVKWQKKIEETEDEEQKRGQQQILDNLKKRNEEIISNIKTDLTPQEIRTVMAGAVETGIDIGTLGLGTLAKKAVGKVAEKTAQKGILGTAKKVATSGLTEAGAFGSVYGGSGVARQEDPTAKDYAVGVGVGTGAGLALGLGGLGLSVGATKLLEKRITTKASTLIEKEVGKLQPDEKTLLSEAIKEGRAKDDIVAEIKKIREVEKSFDDIIGVESPKSAVEPVKVADDAVTTKIEKKPVETKIEPKNLDKAGNDLDEYVSKRGTKLRDVSDQPRDKVGKFDIIGEGTQDQIKENVFNFKKVLDKGVISKDYPFADTIVEDLDYFESLIKKIDSSKVTGKELKEAQDVIDEMAIKMQKKLSLAKVANEAPDVETLAKHIDAEDLSELEINKIWNSRKEFKSSKADITEVNKAIDQALGGKPKFRTFKENFEKSTNKTLTENQEKVILRANEKMFGDKDVRLVGQILTNKKALGKYENGMIEVVAGKGNAKDTLYHEAVHKYLDVFSTAEEYKKALLEAKAKFKIDGTWEEVEETLAEKFIDFVGKKEADLNSGFFKKSLERVKSYFKNLDDVDKLYKDIFEGKAKGKIAKKKVVKETKKTPSKIAKSIETKAVERNLTEGFEEVAGYDKLTIKKDAELSSKLISDDLEKARRIIRGEELSPKEIKNDVSLIVAMEEKIKKTKDLKLATELSEELSKSQLVEETSKAGQTLRVAAERERDSASQKIYELRKAREKNIEKKLKGRKISEVKNKIKKDIKEAIKKKTPTKADWANFVEEIKCK